MPDEKETSFLDDRGFAIRIPTLDERVPDDAAELTPPCVAVVADLVGSRAYGEPERRARLQKQLRSLLADFNASHQRAIVSRFLITAGDEVQGVLRQPQVIPDLVWLLEDELEGPDVRFGFGFGRLHTEIRGSAVGMDGPAFHRARAAVVRAKAEDRLGGVFQGFGERFDEALSGAARLLRWCREQLTDRQREVVRYLRDGRELRDIAAQLAITSQAVGQRAKGAGWSYYRDAEEGWRASLALFDTAALWEAHER